MQVCREIGRRYISLRLGQMEVGDLAGIPYREGEVMHWSRPSWWPVESDAESIVHCDVTVLYANSRIQRVESFRGSGVSAASYHGGGFTDLRPVFAYARKMQPQPAAVIYLTDGIGPAPAEMEFPTLWVLTGEGEKPVPQGVELQLDV